jgi:hypothetical protein
MTRKKTADPKRVALLDRLDKLRADFERNYARMKRAFNRMEKARRGAARLTRQLARPDAVALLLALLTAALAVLENLP